MSEVTEKEGKWTQDNVKGTSKMLLDERITIRQVAEVFHRFQEEKSIILLVIFVQIKLFFLLTLLIIEI